MKILRRIHNKNWDRIFKKKKRKKKMKYKPYNLKDVVKGTSEQEKFTVVSIGGGGSSTGYRLAGGKILCVNEFVEQDINTYKENYWIHLYYQMILKNLLLKILTSMVT